MRTRIWPPPRMRGHIPASRGVHIGPALRHERVLDVGWQPPPQPHRPGHEGVPHTGSTGRPEKQIRHAPL